MKKYSKLAVLAALLMAVMSGCKWHIMPSNPWTNEEPGTEKWFDELTSGEEEDAIYDYKVSDLVGCWQLVATTDKNPDGEIVRFQDWLYTGELDHGGQEYYLQLFEDMKSAYTFHLMQDGYPILRGREGHWELISNKVTFFGKSQNSAAMPTTDGDERYTIELVEKNRVVFSMPSTDNNGNACTYYEIYQRVDGLPDLSDVKLPQELFVESEWKVVADTFYTAVWNEPSDPFTKMDIQPNKFAGCTFKFNTDKTFTVKDKAGAVKTYKWLPNDNPTYIAFIVEEASDPWPSKVVFFSIFDKSQGKFENLKMSGDSERLDHAVDGYKNAIYCHDIHLDIVK